MKSYRIPLFGGCHNLVRTHSRKCRAPGRLSVISIEQTDSKQIQETEARNRESGKPENPKPGKRALTYLLACARLEYRRRQSPIRLF